MVMVPIRAGALQEELERFLLHVRNMGWVRRHRISADRVNYGQLMNRLSLDTTWRESLHFEISDDELRMGGLDALRRWFETIEHDLRRRFDRDRYRGGSTYTRATIDEISPLRARQWEEMARLVQDANLYLAPGAFNEWLWEANPAVIKKRGAADDKAKELFKATAGVPACETLEAGKGLPLKGSLGTDYLLFKKASYCIERPKDGARLCAVVPGVPLWDHLLGVKLMVEHDEPAFLKTANVAGQNPYQFDPNDWRIT